MNTILIFGDNSNVTYTLQRKLDTSKEGIYSFIKVSDKELMIKKGCYKNTILMIRYTKGIDPVSQIEGYGFKLESIDKNTIPFFPRVIIIRQNDTSILLEHQS